MRGGVRIFLTGLTIGAMLVATGAQAGESAATPGRDGDSATVKEAETTFILGEAARLDAAINLRPTGSESSAVQLRHGAKVPSMLLHSGGSDSRFDPLTGDGSFASGAALQGSFGELGYSLDWEASISGGSGSLSLRRGAAELSFGNESSDDVLSSGDGLSASWHPDISLGGLEIQLQGEPRSQDMGGSVSWSFSW